MRLGSAQCWPWLHSLRSSGNGSSGLEGDYACCCSPVADALLSGFPRTRVGHRLAGLVQRNLTELVRRSASGVIGCGVDVPALLALLVAGVLDDHRLSALHLVVRVRVVVCGDEEDRPNHTGGDPKACALHVHVLRPFVFRIGLIRYEATHPAWGCVVSLPCQAIELA